MPFAGSHFHHLRRFQETICSNSECEDLRTRRTTSCGNVASRSHLRTLDAPQLQLLFLARGKRAAGFGADFQNSCCQISCGPALCVRDHGGRPGFLSAWGLELDRGKPKRNALFKRAFKTRNHKSMMCDREHSTTTTAMTTIKL